jgi:protein-L-isoaspartate(D-aspartate) O-methyltransferase
MQLASQLAERGIQSAEVLQAIARLDRVRFLPDAVKSQAGEDAAQPIGYGQTISQPYVVAYMTEALEVEPGMRVLEVGTGSGYQAAVLLEMGVEVFTVERVPELADDAEARLRAMGYTPRMLHVRRGDGRKGWPEAAPFDGILVTAATEKLPPALIAQLAPHGRLVAPVGSSESTQQLLRVRRVGQRMEADWLLPVRFVPLVEGSISG